MNGQYELAQSLPKNGTLVEMLKKPNNENKNKDFD